MNNSTHLPLVHVSTKLSYPPRQSLFTQTFWNGLRTGLWQTTCCEVCRKLTFPPKPVCPHCWSTRVAWRPLSSIGTLYSWTRVHAAPAAFAGETPYAVGIVDLDDGVRLACRLTTTDDFPITAGQKVEMLVLLYDDGPLFAARPVHISSQS